MENIFTKRLPSIDLHGYDTESARVVTTDFIKENIIMKKDKVLIIHGKGKGLVKKSVYNSLANIKEVKKYYTDNLNDGCTIVELNIDN